MAQQVDPCHVSYGLPNPSCIITPSGPLGRVSSHLPQNVVVLIDALDECDGASTFDNPILRLLRDQLAKLPKQVWYAWTDSIYHSNLNAS